MTFRQTLKTLDLSTVAIVEPDDLNIFVDVNFRNDFKLKLLTGASRPGMLLCNRIKPVECDLISHAIH